MPSCAVTPAEPGREPALRLGIAQTRAGLRLRVGGELDIGTEPRLQVLLARLERSPRPVLLDLAGVGFTDSSGLAPILNSARRRRAAGRPPLVVIADSPAVRRVLALLAGDDGVRALLRPSTVDG